MPLFCSQGKWCDSAAQEKGTCDHTYLSGQEYGNKEKELAQSHCLGMEKPIIVFLLVWFCYSLVLGLFTEMYFV